MCVQLSTSRVICQWLLIMFDSFQMDSAPPEEVAAQNHLNPTLDFAERHAQFFVIDEEDGYSIAEMEKARARRSVLSHSAAYATLPAVTVKLSCLKRIADEKDPKLAIELLTKRVTVTIDDKYLIDVEKEEVIPQSSDIYLDFCLAIPRHIGFGALIPRFPDHRYKASFTLNAPYRTFQGFKYAKPQYLYNGRCLFLGESDGESMWLVLAPVDEDGGSDGASDMDSDDEDDPRLRPSVIVNGTLGTGMPAPLYRMMIMFIATVFGRLVENGYQVLSNVYDISLTDERPNFERYTNIM